MTTHPLAKPETLSPAWTEYELLDTGGRRKLERFGAVKVVRPEAQADWRPALAKAEWDAAQAEYVPSGLEKNQGERGAGEWRFSRGVPARWQMRRGDLAFWVEPTPAGHLGVFPDQASHWDWLASSTSLRNREALQRAPEPPRILSLFGYTGLATLACAAAGAQVTHVDASRKAIKWARENQALAGLEERAIRWLVDDAPAFVAREIRRERKYDGLILDPPRFGRGPKGELWKVEDALPALLRQCRELLSARPLLVLLNTYTTVLTRGQSRHEAAQLYSYLQEMMRDKQGAVITSGELVFADSTGRQISNSVFARAEMGGPQRLKPQ